jgi:hypothetical protein
MVLAIEPMVNMGKPSVKVLADGWTAVTSDGSLSAHFEHSVAVTSAGPWILTALPAPRRGLGRGRAPGLRRHGPEADEPEAEAGRDVEVEGVVEAQLPSALYRVRLAEAGRAAGRTRSRGRARDGDGAPVGGSAAQFRADPDRGAGPGAAVAAGSDRGGHRGQLGPG